MSEQADAFVQGIVNGRRRPGGPLPTLLHAGDPGFAASIPEGEPTLVVHSMDANGLQPGPGVRDVVEAYGGQRTRTRKLIISFGPKPGTYILIVEEDDQILIRVTVSKKALEETMPILSHLAHVKDWTVPDGPAQAAGGG